MSIGLSNEVLKSERDINLLAVPETMPHKELIFNMLIRGFIHKGKGLCQG